MYAKYVQKGDSIDYRAAEMVAAGDVVALGDLAGIARLDIPAGALGSLAVVGVFDVVKSNAAIPPGAPVYWDRVGRQATLTAGENAYLGKSLHAAEAADETVRVLLNSPVSLRGALAAGVVIGDLADHSGGVGSEEIPALTDLGTRDAVASLVLKTNAILAALRTVGILPGA